MLEPAQAARAKELYFYFFSEFKQANPTDLNTIEKFDFAVVIGFEDLHLMQVARKYSHDFTLYSLWVAEQNRLARIVHARSSMAQLDHVCGR